MTDVLPFVLAGLTVGSVYALAGSGLVLTFKTSGIFNFGHGALATVGRLRLLLHVRRGRAASRPVPDSQCPRRRSWSSAS